MVSLTAINLELTRTAVSDELVLDDEQSYKIKTGDKYESL